MLRAFILKLAKKVAKSEKESLSAFKRPSCILGTSRHWGNLGMYRGKRGVEYLPGPSFIAITSCNRLPVFDYFLSFKLGKQTLKLLHRLHYSLSMGMLGRGWCWLFLQPRNRCCVWEIYSVCESHEGLKMSYLMEGGSWFGICLHVTDPQLKWRTFGRSGRALHKTRAACHWLVTKTMDRELILSDVVFQWGEVWGG